MSLGKFYDNLSDKDQETIIRHLHELVLEENPETMEEFYRLAQIVTMAYLMFVYHDRYGLTLNTMKEALNV